MKPRYRVKKRKNGSVAQERILWFWFDMHDAKFPDDVVQGLVTLLNARDEIDELKKRVQEIGAKTDKRYKELNNKAEQISKTLEEKP